MYSLRAATSRRRPARAGDAAVPAMLRAVETVRAGDRFVVTDDLSTQGLSAWRAPSTFGFDTVIPKGTVLVAPNDQAPGATGFACIPEQSEKLEELLVPQETREAPKYAGYYFVLNLEDIGTRIQRV